MGTILVRLKKKLVKIDFEVERLFSENNCSKIALYFKAFYLNLHQQKTISKS
jgi:hypothetical protein